MARNVVEHLVIAGLHLGNVRCWVLRIGRRKYDCSWFATVRTSLSSIGNSKTTEFTLSLACTVGRELYDPSLLLLGDPLVFNEVLDFGSQVSL